MDVNSFFNLCRGRRPCVLFCKQTNPVWGFLMRISQFYGARAQAACSAAILVAGFSGAAVAQDVRIGDLKVQFFLESSGRLSDDVLTRSNLKLTNLPRGEGEFGEPINTVILTVSLLGQKNTQPKFASGMINITTTNRTGQRKTETRPLLGFVFGEDGKVHRAIALDNITCSKVEVEVKMRGGSKRASLPFQCNDPKEEAPKPAPAAGRVSGTVR
jgi:hypothetical protein